MPGLDEFIKNNAECISLVYCVFTSILLGMISFNIGYYYGISDKLTVLIGCANGIISIILYLKMK